MSNINQLILGDDDDDESETEFNPGAERGSDDEQSDNEDRDTKDGIAPKAEREQTVDRINGNKPKARDSPSDELKEEDEDDAEGDLDNGEDDEGEGEDLGNGDDDDEEDEDEDEDDEDAVTGRPRKRRRRGLNQFIEEEAEVDEDDDELEADEDDVAETGFIQDTHPDDDLGPEADQDDRRHRELDRQRQMEASIDAEAAAQRLKERYGRRTTQGLSKGSFVPQNLLMPSVDDPSIWGFQCKPGKEKEIVMALTKKIQQRMITGRSLKICSAFERGGPGAPMQGFVFVEAKRKQDAEDALIGISDVYVRRQNLVPVKEMPDLLRVKKSKPLEIGAYVRIKRGPYGGDLGMVNEFEENGNDVEVRLVPRLDYGLNEDVNKPVQEKRKRPNAFTPAVTPVNRPPQRLFNENEAKKRTSRLLQNMSTLTGRKFIYAGATYEDGFLLKMFKLNALETEKVDPKLEEITKLTKTAADGSETLDLETLAHSLKSSAAEGAYVPGDEIEVYQGEQKGIIGRVEGVIGSILRIKVSQGELTGKIVEQPLKGVRKRFKDGDHVKVIGSSRYNGEVGMVLRIKDDRVTVLTDTSMQEITVFSKDLREAAEAGGSDNKSTGFDVQDLVQINATEVGIVIKADQEAVRILDENSSVITRLPSQLQKVEVKKNTVATDRNGSEIRVGDIIREAQGENKSGRILHIHRAHVFVHDRQKIEDAGLWTTRCMNVVTISSKANMTQQSGPDLTKMNPALGGNNGAMAPPPKTIGRDRLIGQLIHIRKGPYKGHKGLVKDTTASAARIELQSKNKVINIEKQDLAVVDKNTNKTMDYNTFANSRGPPRAGGMPGSRIPDSGFSGSRTPAVGGDGGRTPAWGASSARTPAWSGAGGGMDSGRTPAWKPSSGSATSYGGSGGMTSYGGAGGMTSYGGAGNYGASGGGRTPAWSASARTPYGGSDGFGAGSGSSGYDAFATGSRTPYAGAGASRTPAWGGPNSNATTAPTPAARPYDAPTPAISAPTPGGFDGNDGSYTAYGANAPTPGAGFDAGAMDAPTPGFTPGFAKGSNREELKYNRLTVPVAAATPAAGGYDAPTPAAGGPRYAEDDDDE
ncbi:transcription elongation factor spt5 [Knufia fluminis]|uniref:Transcription elongation factor SPT5 n=1 Tax=Knufia fluminis TaxID=191047 RepID=A0AAN8EQC1_9EURO|nr:transcription elongation factor spt5 [Knufia fluminis]